MLLASSEGDPWWVELELDWKSKGIDFMLVGFFVKFPNLNGINQTKACLKELAIHRLLACKVHHFGTQN